MKLWKKAATAVASPAEIVREKLGKQAEIRPFPAAVTQLLSAMQDPQKSSADLAKIIECDPSLSVRLLRLANSPLYGLSHEVRSITHATSMLGNRALKTLAMSAAGAAMFSSGSTAGIERERLWKHSLGAAAVARVLGELDPRISSDDAFLACVFHDVGKLFLLDVLPDDYVEMCQSLSGLELVEQEQAIFEITHPEIGFQSAQIWNLAENLKVAIGYHHRPAEAPAHAELASIVYMANKFARAWGIGSEPQSEVECFANDPILHNLEFEPSVLAHVRESAEAAFAETQDVCA